jgi:2-polyprenyl-3-methyl-5-hydroxy-6-metoxy-1,4-benzoquinol methylase
MQGAKGSARKARKRKKRRPFMNTTKTFYDNLANLYHLIYPDWNIAITRQGKWLSSIIKSHDLDSRTVLDSTCGIGTQSLGLAALGFRVTASDISPKAIIRAKKEASIRNLEIPFSVADIRNLWTHHNTKFDIVLSCDNSLPHLLDDQSILLALQNMYQCTRKGGLCIISMRDYLKENNSIPPVQFYGVRTINKTKCIIFQTRDYIDKLHYSVKMYFVRDTSAGSKVSVFKSKYYAL